MHQSIHEGEALRVESLLKGHASKYYILLARPDFYNGPDPSREDAHEAVI